MKQENPYPKSIAGIRSYLRTRYYQTTDSHNTHFHPNNHLLLPKQPLHPNTNRAASTSTTIPLDQQILNIGKIINRYEIPINYNP